MCMIGSLNAHSSISIFCLKKIKSCTWSLMGKIKVCAKRSINFKKLHMVLFLTNIISHKYCSGIFGENVQYTI